MYIGSHFSIFLGLAVNHIGSYESSSFFRLEASALKDMKILLQEEKWWFSIVMLVYQRVAKKNMGLNKDYINSYILMI